MYADYYVVVAVELLSRNPLGYPTTARQTIREVRRVYFASDYVPSSTCGLARARFDASINIARDCIDPRFPVIHELAFLASHNAVELKIPLFSRALAPCTTHQPKYRSDPSHNLAVHTHSGHQIIFPVVELWCLRVVPSGGALQHTAVAAQGDVL